MEEKRGTRWAEMNRRLARARSRALRRLAQAHGAEFRDLLDEERGILGLGPVPR